MKLTKRKGFNFYRSYYDVFNELPDDDKLKFIKALLDKQFLDIEPENLEGITKFAWISQYNSIDQQVKGYKSKTKDPMQGGTQGGTQGGSVRGDLPPTLQEEEKGEEKEKGEYTLYTKVEFLDDWNNLRTKHLKKPSNLNRLDYELQEILKDIVDSYKPEEIRNSLIGLFKQKKLPNDNTVMQSSPKHFLNHFESYLTAYYDMNTSLYGKTEN